MHGETVKLVDPLYVLKICHFAFKIK